MPEKQCQGLRFAELLKLAQEEVDELFPWDVEDLMENKVPFILLDIREPYEYRKLRIENSINVPRGLLEIACDWGYDETVPRLVEAKKEKIIIACRSGNRSLLAAKTMKCMGYEDVYSLKTGLKGWNEYELPLVNDQGVVDIEAADDYHMAHVTEAQKGPRAVSD